MSEISEKENSGNIASDVKSSPEVRMNISFSPPDISELEIEEVADTLRSGWITTGPKTKKLEKDIAAYAGSAGCACLNSQTACAEMALRLLGIGPGDEVITTAYTYTATCSVICHVGAKPVLVDIQKNSLEMDYDAAEKAINKNTKAVIAVDVAGIPCDYERIYAIAERKKALFRPRTELQEALGRIAVLADTAHSFGASRKGVMAGAMADFSSFSFHAVKNFTTAEGGALTWREIDGIDNEAIYKTLMLLSLHGQSKDALAKTKPGAWEYDVVGPYFKCNMTDIMASLGLAQMKRYPALLARRREIIGRYDAALLPLGVEVLPHYTEEYASSGHLYIARVPGINHTQRCEIITKTAEAGVACNVHYKPLPMLTAYKSMGFDIKSYPNAFAHYENAISLPLHTKLTDEEIGYVIEKFTETVRNYV